MLRLSSLAFLLLVLTGPIGCGDSSPRIKKPDNPAPLPDASDRVGGSEDTPETQRRIPLEPRQPGR